MANPRGKQQTRLPIAVLISDIHYNLQTLSVADAATRMAVATASKLGVALIVAGDLHDTKANMRAECVKAMLDTFNRATTPVYIIRGNHCSINEKSTEHSLEFLRLTATIVDTNPLFVGLEGTSVTLIPYYHDAGVLGDVLGGCDEGDILIMHQGLNGSEAGEYIQDKSALNYEDVADFTVISGHYHRRQTIDTGRGRTFSYIGNPYTLGFGEANDPAKGFQVLYSDGSLEFIPTNLRKHVKISVMAADTGAGVLLLGVVNVPHEHDDLVWVNVTGQSDVLTKVTKDMVAQAIKRPTSFRLTLDALEVESSHDEPEVQTLSKEETFDAIIDSLTNTDDERKKRLKKTWKELL